MSHYEIRRHKDIHEDSTFKVFINEEKQEPMPTTIHHWIATFKLHSHAVAYVKSLKPTSIKGEIL